MRKRWKVAVVSACSISAAAVLLFSLPTALPGHITDRPATLRVSAANLRRGNPRPQDAARRLEGFDADLLVALEWTGKNLDLESMREGGLVPVLDEPRHGAHGILVLARRTQDVEASLVRSRTRTRCGRPVATIRLRFGAEWVSVVGVHSPPPEEGCGAGSASPTTVLADLVVNGQMLRDFGVCRKGDPVIVAGDLNALPWFPDVKRLLRSGLRDTYAESRWRPTGTWTAFSWVPSLARIDFILASRDLVASDAWVVGLPGSDHRAVIADVRGFGSGG
jgi:endonuclease/exonuclease/phosphatase (EEP) superfamily protein YafD